MLYLVIEPREASLAPGMDVRRIPPFQLRRMVGPFIIMKPLGERFMPWNLVSSPRKKIDQYNADCQQGRIILKDRPSS